MNETHTVNASSASEGKIQTKRVPFAVVEAYKTIRTNLTFLQAASKSKTVAVTSSDMGDGKSTTSVNVAIAFSQLGEKTLIIDADLRRCSVHKKLKINNDKGLTNVLAGITGFKDAVKSVTPCLDVLTTGQVPPNPSELLGSAAFRELLDTAREEYDHIIIDTPPVNIVSDALIVGAETGGLVFVIRENHTTTESYERAVAAAKFANINILGVIINGTNSRGSKYKYNRYKKYGYRYKYSYSAPKNQV